MPDLAIRGGTLVTPAGIIAADIAIDGEYISDIAPDLSGFKNIDASGLTVFPGIVDVHVHFNDPGRADWEGAETGSHALAAGGGTTFIDMPLNSSPCTVNAANFDQKLAALGASSIADFALWGGIVPGNLSSLAELAGRGVIGFKAFMCDSGLPEFPRADDLTLFEGMREAARLNLPVAVHAENHEIAGPASRPVIAEVEAIHRAGVLAREAGCALHIVHISSGSGIAAALAARALGTDISIETCPHYLFFSDDDLARTGALLKCAPPLRNPSERDALRKAVSEGNVDIVGSDHSPCLPEMKRREKFTDIWGGIAGVQSTLRVLLELGFSPQIIAAVTAANGAQRFRLKGKGAIQIGGDADLALVDLAARTVDAARDRHRANPYAVYPLRGRIVNTIRRGEVIFADGVNPARTKGKFIHAS